MPAISQTLEIPPDKRKELLPDATLSILDFLQFSFPAPVSSSSVASAINVDKHLSSLPPNVLNAQAIRSAPMLPISVIEHLLGSPRLSASQSILCVPVHSTIGEQRLPRWVLTYWNEITRLRPLRSRWTDAEDQLQALRKHKARSENTAALVGRAYNALASTSWSANIKGFSASIPTYHLSTYLTRQWLSDEHENQMLDLLRHEVNHKQKGDEVDVGDVFFLQRLSRLHREGVTEYISNKSYEWLHRKGQEFGTGVYEKFVTISNIEENHWVAIVVDFKLSMILYGDSMGGMIDDDLETALTWWIHYHTAKYFPVTALPITRQRDGYSCGILAWNALNAYLFPEDHKLANTAFVADERLKVLLCIVDRHNDKVS